MRRIITLFFIFMFVPTILYAGEVITKSGQTFKINEITSAARDICYPKNYVPAFIEGAAFKIPFNKILFIDVNKVKKNGISVTIALKNNYTLKAELDERLRLIGTSPFGKVTIWVKEIKHIEF